MPTENTAQELTGDQVDPRMPVQSTDTDTAPAARPTFRARLRIVWQACVGGIGFVLGLVPHVLHHVGILAGTALVAGSGGTVLFGALGFLASIPFLLRLRRRFGTWRAPAIGLVIFVAMFSLSTFVIGPAISGNGSANPTPSVPSMNHDGHH